MLLFSAVLQNSFRFAVFPKRLITFNPMQYVKLRGRLLKLDPHNTAPEGPDINSCSLPLILPCAAYLLHPP